MTLLPQAIIARKRDAKILAGEIAAFISDSVPVRQSS
jgi:hypothetical protein